ncbi:DUF4249 family protein [Sediminicola luteus]|uniref:DUF4249 domain-containing protein n=1 Tax=Sediminicola luteus TaxID=319238 RepID=A0A2A4G6N6_9FLAO|nr:DUF4249 family protein [Sediminicola luteus]PCE63640.1 hypothetical protein B7P33_10165 [Sediminicola luteus]
MKAKYNLFVFLLMAGFISCEEVVDIETQTGPERLVIDASFSLYVNADEPRAEGAVILSKTRNFFEKDPFPVNGAEVQITNTRNGDVIRFTEFNDSGVYLPIDFDLVTEQPLPNDVLELTVIAEGETYWASTTFVPSVPIDTIEQGDGELFGDETEIIISFTDDGSREDYYLFDLDFNLFLTSEDTYYQGQQFTFSYFYENIEEGRTANVSIIGIDKQFYDYMRQLIEQSGQEGGGPPFDAPPATLRGNIINTTNPTHYPLGYFAVSEAYSKSITLSQEVVN